VCCACGWVCTWLGGREGGWVGEELLGGCVCVCVCVCVCGREWVGDV